MNLTLSEDAGVMQGVQLVGSAAFAVSTSLTSRQRRTDLFGVTALALVPALGGGTLLDVVLDTTPVFWIAAPGFVLVPLCAALASALGLRRVRLRRLWLARWADAAGVAAWTVAGTELCLARGTGPWVAVMLGGLGGVTGGLLRDVCLRRSPSLLTDEFYATAVLLGAALHLLFAQMPLGTLLTFWLSAGAVLVLRGVAIQRPRR